MKTIIVLTFLLDQVCKYWVNQNVAEGESRKLLKGKLYITNIKNKGLAMGVLSEKRCILRIASALALAYNFHLYIRSEGCEKLGAAFMAGGGLSNIFDRFAKGEVTDYLYLCPSKKVPVFNLADVFALIGFVTILISGFLKFSDAEKNG